jgi:cell fate (sporulation/competence/biofilm development) regulator YmcA (YheA/YmcA/DUF963 family)
MEILVFKSNLSNSSDIKNVSPGLNLHPCVKEWNVDLYDSDTILSKVTDRIDPAEVEKIIINTEYYCEALK